MAHNNTKLFHKICLIQLVTHGRAWLVHRSCVRVANKYAICTSLGDHQCSGAGHARHVGPCPPSPSGF